MRLWSALAGAPPLGPVLLANVARFTPITPGRILAVDRLNSGLFQWAVAKAASAADQAGAPLSVLSLRHHQDRLREHLHDDTGEIHLLIARHLELLALISGGDGSASKPLGPVLSSEDAVAVLQLMRVFGVLQVNNITSGDNGWPLVACTIEHVQTKRKSEVHFALWKDCMSGGSQSPLPVSNEEKEAANKLFAPLLAWSASIPSAATETFESSSGVEAVTQFACNVFAQLHGQADPNATLVKCVAAVQTLLSRGGVESSLSEVREAVALSACGAPEGLMPRAMALIVGAPLSSPVGTCVHLANAVIRKHT